MKTKRLEFFEKDQIPWTGTNELHDFYKTLLELHATHPALRAGDPSVTTYRINTTSDENIFSYLRKSGNKEVLVLINFSYTPKVNFEITGDHVKGVYKNVFTGNTLDASGARFELEAWDYLVLER